MDKKGKLNNIAPSGKDVVYTSRNFEGQGKDRDHLGNVGSNYSNDRKTKRPPSDLVVKSLRFNSISPANISNILSNNFDPKQQKSLIMLKIILALFLCIFPLSLIAQQKVQKKCKDKNRGIDQLPCSIVYRYGIDVIPDEETIIKYVDILIKKRNLLDPEKAKPYKISLIEDNKIWHIVVKSDNCRYCKIYININKNTGEVLNFYGSEDGK
ncbi:hypothetical protein [Chryseobacterium sp. Mn2064]|uniref:hypothetical protein n=1 Tax=Chryseobacterium sp. Mn2064 TaxID=3395263 RepID=UPI003BE4782A